MEKITTYDKFAGRAATEIKYLISDMARSKPQNDSDRPENWADFLRQHPQFANDLNRTIAFAFASDRDISEQFVSIDMQQLAGSLIRTTFTNDELVAIHEGTYLNLNQNGEHNG